MSERPQDERKISWNTAIILGVFTMITSFVSSFLMSKTDMVDIQSSNWAAIVAEQSKMIESVRKELRDVKIEVNTLKESEERWRARYIEKTMEYVDVMKKLSQNIRELEVAKKWVHDMPFSSWAKKRNKNGDLEIIAINQRFTANYGLTEKEAVGKLDIDLHPRELALEYVADDEYVIRTGRPLVKVVDYEKEDGTIVKMPHVKWRLEWSDGTYGAAGMVLLYDEFKISD